MEVKEDANGSISGSSRCTFIIRFCDGTERSIGFDCPARRNDPEQLEHTGRTGHEHDNDDVHDVGELVDAIDDDGDARGGELVDSERSGNVWRWIT